MINKNLTTIFFLSILIVLLANKSTLEKFICKKRLNASYRYTTKCNKPYELCTMSRKIPVGYTTVTKEMKKIVKGKYVDFDEVEEITPPLCSINGWTTPNKKEREQINQQRKLIHY